MNEYPVIGMSPGNSYFKEEIVRELLKSVVEKYGRTAILIADIPAISTYEALGYPTNIARKEKALPQGNNLRNKVIRAKEYLGFKDEQVRVIDWKNEIQNDPQYLKKYSIVTELYNSNLEFRESANDATREVLEYSDREIANLEEAVGVAVHYLLSEIAFMEYMPEYLDTEKVTYIYHRNWQVYEKYITGEFDSNPRPYLGFEIIKTQTK